MGRKEGPHGRKIVIWKFGIEDGRETDGRLTFDPLNLLHLIISRVMSISSPHVLSLCGNFST